MSENKLDVLISGIRKKLGKELIETVKGVGYRLGKM
jgi:DNA-binding response OmpR family regulator